MPDTVHKDLFYIHWLKIKPKEHYKIPWLQREEKERERAYRGAGGEVGERKRILQQTPHETMSPDVGLNSQPMRFWSILFPIVRCVHL